MRSKQSKIVASFWLYFFGGGRIITEAFGDQKGHDLDHLPSDEQIKILFIRPSKVRIWIHDLQPAADATKVLIANSLE